MCNIVSAKIVAQSYHNRTTHHSIRAQAASSSACGRFQAMSDRCDTAARLTEAYRGNPRHPIRLTLSLDARRFK